MPRADTPAASSYWSGKAVAASRTEFDELLKREEMDQSGVYVLTGADPDTGKPMAYGGEAEALFYRTDKKVATIRGMSD